MMQKPEGRYILDKTIREEIKSRSMLPSDTLRYIEALERVAREAFSVWWLNNHTRDDFETHNRFDLLFDALEVVDFMDDE